jgi:hypothetical protein
MNPEYYIITSAGVTSGPYLTAEEARRNVPADELRRYSDVKITRVIAVSSTKATFKVTWDKPYDLGEDCSADTILREQTLEG